MAGSGDGEGGGVTGAEGEVPVARVWTGAPVPVSWVLVCASRLCTANVMGAGVAGGEDVGASVIEAAAVAGWVLSSGGEWLCPDHAV